MSTQSLHARLKSLAEANCSVSQLIARLARLASSADPTQTDDGQVRAELSAEIQASLKELEQEFELAKQDAEDVTSAGSISGSANWGSGSQHRRRDSERDRERVTIATQVERVSEDLKLARAQFHKAQLQAQRQAQRNAEARSKRDREQLFADAGPAGSRSHSRRREKQPQDELVLSASGDVTAALRRTHQLMQSELQRSHFAHETLQRSTAALQQLNESYSTLDTLLVSSKSLVSTLVRSQKSDTWYLETAFWILAYTIAWLVFRRIFYGPIRYFFYIPLRLVLHVLLSISQFFVALLVGSSKSKATETPLRSLKIQPSATGRGYTRNPDMPAPSVRVGVGGEGARRAQGDKMDEVGRMAEETREQERGQQSSEQPQQVDESAELPEEEEGQNEEQGEGTVLRERMDDEPRNPKKRMWEEPTPPAGERVKDEL